MREERAMSNRANPYVDRYFGNYQITAEIACGSFGSVYKARHIYLPRIATVKLLHKVRINSFQDRERFFREAGLFEKLEHPYILPVYETGIEGEIPYLVTEYAPGGSLRDLLQRRLSTPLSVKDATTILSQIGEALYYAHQRNIFHHDLKPENILFKSSGDVLLADFSLASIQSATKSTSVATMKGTPVYMAPEQLLGRASAASDQYALGMIAYELLTGRTHFATSPDDTWGTQIHKHRQEKLSPLAQINPAIPQAVEQTILKALAKHPRERYVNVAAFITALQIAVDQSREESVFHPLTWYEKELEEYEQILRSESLSEEKETSLDKGNPLPEIAEYLTRPFVEKALAQLSWVERSCLLLYIDAQFTLDEIAEIMSIDKRQVCEALEQGCGRILQSYYLSLEKEQILSSDHVHTPAEKDIARIANLLMSITPVKSERSTPLTPAMRYGESSQFLQGNEEGNNPGSISGHGKPGLEFRVAVLCPDKFSELVFDEPESMIPIIKKSVERVLREFLGTVNAEVILHPGSSKDQGAKDMKNRDEDVPIPTPERPVRVCAV